MEESEETEGRGVEEELGLRTCTEDGVVSEGEDVSLSKHNTWNYTKRTNVKTKDSFFLPTILQVVLLPAEPSSS